MDGKQRLVELVMLSTGDEILAMVRRESCLRKKQDGVSVRGKQMVELMPACAALPSSVEGSPLIGTARCGTQQMVVEA